MDNLKLEELLLKAINEKIKSEEKRDIGNLSGSNGLLFDDYNFEAERSDNCPRLALARRVIGVKEPRTVASWLSNNHGRTFEDLLRKILSYDFPDKPEITFKEEEEVEVFFKDENDNILLSARPDKVAYINGQKFPIEVKTVQSSTTAYYIFIKERPHVGALIQLAIYMMGHNVKKGYLLYCQSTWFYGFAGRGNSWKIAPGFKIFEIEEINGEFFYNKKKTVVTSEKILKGAREFLNLQNNNKLPSRPIWIDSKGEVAKYGGCAYCFFKETCNKMEEENETKLDVFFDRCHALVKNGYSTNKGE